MTQRGNHTSGTKQNQGNCNTRAIVLELLLLMEQETQYANRLLKGTLDKYDYLTVQDKSFIKRLFEGCVERRIQLDYVINCFSKTKTKNMKPLIREVLRMGVYQILYMDQKLNHLLQPLLYMLKKFHLNKYLETQNNKIYYLFRLYMNLHN